MTDKYTWLPHMALTKSSGYVRRDVTIHLPWPQCAAASCHWLLLAAKLIIFEIDEL